MARAQERLRQLSLAQEAAAEEADRIKVQPRFRLPRGKGIIDRPSAPSAAGSLDPSEATPFSDFGEMFLNQMGISSKRQRTAKVETLAAINSANQTIYNAVEEQALQIEKRGIGGSDVDLFKNSRAMQEKAAQLMDSPDASVREYGQAMMQTVATSYDQLNKDHAERLKGAKEGMTGRLNGMVDLSRAEASANDTVIAQLNEYGKRNGIGAQLPALVKQSVADYLGGAPYSQKGEETQGMFENLPGFNVAFDPTEELTVGNASALVAAVKAEREKTFAGSFAKEIEAATNAGFRLQDKDGKLTAEEIPVSELEPDISRILFNLPSGEPLNIRPGLPTAADAARTAQANANVAKGTTNQMVGRAGEVFNVENFMRGVRRLTGQEPFPQAPARPTND